MTTLREKCDKVIDKAIRCLEMNEEANHRIRFYKLVSFVHLQVDNIKDDRLKNPMLLTALAFIAWNSCDKGKCE